MNRAELSEKMLGIKREKGWSWKHICGEIGGMSPLLITGAVLGQMKLTKPQAAKAVNCSGLARLNSHCSTRCRTVAPQCRRPTR